MLMSRIQLASKNIFVGFANNIITMVLGFVSRAIFIQTLGNDILGINSVFTNLIQMLSLAELGLTNVMIFSYYKPLAEGDKKKLAALVRYYKKLYLGIAGTVFLIGVITIPILPFVINVDQSIPDLSLAYMLFVIDVVLSYLFVYKATILRADQRGFIVTTYEMIGNTLRTICQIAALLLTGSYVFYLALKVIFTLATNFISARRAEKDYHYISEAAPALSRIEKREVFDTIKSGFIYKLSAVLLNSSTNIIISILIGTVIVGYLANYETIIVAVTSISVITFTNMTASVGNLVVLEKEETRLSVFNSMLFIGGWLTVVFVSCTFLLSNSFIALWIGSEYILPDSTVILKMVLMFMSCIMQPIFSYREAVGLYRKTRYVMLAAALVNVALACILGSVWGLDGILLASIISCAATYFWYEPKILYRDYFDSPCFGYFKKILFVFFATVAFSSVGYAVMSLIPSAGWGMWTIEAVTVFLVSNLFCLIIFHQRNEFKDVKNALKTLLTKEKRA